MKQSPFKTYAHSTRVQTCEANGVLGINLNNNPLTEGYCKSLVNFEINEDNTLSPRKGLRTYQVGVAKQKLTTNSYEAGVEQETLLSFVETSYEITSGHTNTTAGLAYTDSFLLRAGTKIYYIGVDPTSIAMAKHQVPIACPDILPNIPVKNYIIKKLTDNGHYVDNVPTASTQTEVKQIHKEPITNPEGFKELVHCFAWNDRLFYFDTVTKKLTMFDPNKGINGITTLTAYSPLPSECNVTGFNMLQANPYVLEDNDTIGAVATLHGGVWLDAKTNKFKLNAKKGQPLKLRVYYTAPAQVTYNVVWEWQNNNGADWTVIKQGTFQDGQPLTVDFTPPVDYLTVRCSIIKATAQLTDPFEQVITITGDFSVNTHCYNLAEEANYDLSQCTGMCFWKRRLVLYGSKEDASVVFTSYPDQPEYFPYPNGVLEFEEAVLKIIPYGEQLIVVTATKMFTVSLNADGLTYTQAVIQAGLNIRKEDAHLILLVKNMVFFKSGNYFYMIVPKASSTTGELQIAPISKNITLLLDNFGNNVRETFNNLYDTPSDSLSLVNYKVHSDYNDIVITYSFKTAVTETYFNYCLIYSTLSRAWSVQTYESNTLLKCCIPEFTKRASLVTTVPITQRVYRTTTSTTKSLPAIVYVTADGDPEDIFLAAGGTYEPILDTAQETIACTTLQISYPAYQWYDVGLRNIDLNHKKRFREVQLLLFSEQDKLKFYNQFIIDGKTRKDLYKYNLIDVVPSGENYGIINLQRVYEDPVETQPSDTVLSEWVLDASAFPSTTIFKVRVPVSGKGFACQFKILSQNLKRYTLLSLNWVYKSMYSR